MTPTIKVIDVEAGTEIEREMNEQELKEHETFLAEQKAIAKTVADNDMAKKALLEKLGITAEEAALL